jgi:hypothetical protein
MYNNASYLEKPYCLYTPHCWVQFILPKSDEEFALTFDTRNSYVIGHPKYDINPLKTKRICFI